MIYISLTTVPDRMNFEYSSRVNLLSLLNQKTDKEYKVLYNVPYTYKEKDQVIEIPEWVNKLAEEDNKLVVNRVKDYGPITKITGALLYTKNPEDVIIVCDDDQEYHEEMLEYHLYKRKTYPKAAIGFRGDRLYEKREWEEEGVKKFIFTHVPDTFPVFKDLNMMITGHWHSISYIREVFKDDFLDESFLYDNHWSDDILVAYYFAKNDLDIKCVHWEKETDFRPVNYYGKPCNTFPIIRFLPFESNTGCFVLRNRTGEHVNDQVTYPQDWVKFLLEYYAPEKIHTQNG